MGYKGSGGYEGYTIYGAYVELFDEALEWQEEEDQEEEDNGTKEEAAE